MKNRKKNTRKTQETQRKEKREAKGRQKQDEKKEEERNALLTRLRYESELRCARRFLSVFEFRNALKVFWDASEI